MSITLNIISLFVKKVHKLARKVTIYAKKNQVAINIGAEEGTRTLILLRAIVPQTIVSANSTTSAHCPTYYYKQL